MANNRQTGPRAAWAAGAMLANPKATRAERSAARSALSQAAGKASKK